ncbi:hypothetical protein BXY66_4146 [Shimia isoporae]|uniref:Sensory/regulatory protein RpfC n=2 Tax=Shimia isoporae TaxID=647720 RepID=A0A4R1N8A4_9RHOB|nr:hypothetical protein BXY66_4146 [Shimia isoporae]
MSDGAPRSIQDAIIATRREKERIDVYVTDRLQRTKVRILLYVFGCALGYIAMGPWLTAAAFALLVVSDLVDVFLLWKFVRPLAIAGKTKRAQRIAYWGGVTQGAGFALAPSFYFFTVEQPDIIFVVGCLGLGAVNSAIVLPQNPKIGITRLVIYGLTPIVMVVAQHVFFGSWNPVVINNPAIIMLLGCMLYMTVTFTKAGMVNYDTNRALYRSREDLKVANAHMARQQAEMRRLSQVAQRANDTVIITDKDRRIVWVNDAFTQHSGYSSEEAIGQNVAELMTQNDPEILANNAIDQAVARGESFRGEVESMHKSGHRYWLDINLFPIRDEDGELEFFVTIERDVTEAKELAKEMAEARAQAEMGARAKAEFLANMSHEIRTPLTGVMGMADLLADTQLDAEQQRFADTIRGSSMSLMAIINDILDLSKLDAGLMEMNPVVFSPVCCFRETLDLLEPMAQSKGLELKLEVGEGVPDRALADDGRIRQVATNIIGNAIKFTEAGSVTLRLEAPSDTRLTFSVQDTGIGIPPEKLESIFDHFTQAEASTTRRFGGSGLGLSISRHIVGIMGGEITVESVVGSGSIFRVTLDIEKPDFGAVRVEERAQSTPEEGPIQLKEGLSILIAEDNQTNRFLLGKYLKEQPISLDFAVDGVEALEKVADHDFDLIFMDMSMPRMGGVQATREIRMLPKSQPTIVALTAHAFEEERLACLAAGMDDFLTKPIRKAELLGWIAAFQNGKKPGAEAA